MAKAIRQIRRVDPTPEDIQARSLSQIISALAENGESIIKLLDIIKQLDEMGVLNALDGLLKNRMDIAEIALGQLNQPAMYNVVKNGMNVFKFLGSLPPEHLRSLLGGVANGIEKANEAEGKTSLWKIGKSMRSPEVKQSLATMVGILEGMGEALKSKHDELH
ncbi:MAG: DUF1641 domain-containing protein [Tuberibacillus sp.]